MPLRFVHFYCSFGEEEQSPKERGHDAFARPWQEECIDWFRIAIREGASQQVTYEVSDLSLFLIRLYVVKVVTASLLLKFSSPVYDGRPGLLRRRYQDPCPPNQLQ